MNIPSDAYGPLNVYSSGRNAQYNPGGRYSQFTSTGEPIREEYDPSSGDEDPMWAQLGIPPPSHYLASRQPAAPVSQGLRKSSRLAGVEVFNPDTICNGQQDNISFTRINSNGMKLDADGRCYNIKTLLDMYDRGNLTSPFTRQPFTERDVRRIESFRASYYKGGKKHKKSTKVKKSTKNMKHKKTKKNTKKKTRRHK